MPDFTILAGTTDGVAINWDRDYYDAESITVFAPAYVEVLSWQASYDGGVTWLAVNDNTNAAVKVPAASTVITYNGIFGNMVLLRIHAGANVAADRIFHITKNYRT